MSRLPRVTGKECARALEKAGFTVARVVGSHHTLAHVDGRKTVIPIHGNEVLGPGLIHRILVSAGVSREEFERLMRE